MLVKQFKNGNIHIKYEPRYDDYRLHHTVNPSLYIEPPTYADMVCAIYNCIELDCIEYTSIYEYYGMITIINHASNNMQYDYPILASDMQNFFNGKWVVLKPIRL